jgi:hypothetical protein
VSESQGEVAAALIDALRPGAAIGVAVHDEDPARARHLALARRAVGHAAG